MASGSNRGASRGRRAGARAGRAAVGAGRALVEALAAIGEATIAFVRGRIDTLVMVGETTRGLGRWTVRRERLPRGELSAALGVATGPVVVCALAGFVLGLGAVLVAVPPLEIAEQLDVLPGVVTFAMLRHVGPLVAALLLALRVAPAFAQAARVVERPVDQRGQSGQGERDALCAVAPLALPRLFAATVAAAVLAVYTEVFGLLGSALGAVGVHGLDGGRYFEGIVSALFPEAFGIGIALAAILGAASALSGCAAGFQARASGIEPGVMGRRATVGALFWIVAIVLAAWPLAPMLEV